MPPAHSSSVANGVPSGASQLPGSSTSPDTEKIFVPPLFGLPISRYFCGPIASKKGTAAKVSVLLMVVGLPNKPKLAGNGGLKRGSPFLPSMDSSSAVSSPLIFVPDFAVNIVIADANPHRIRADCHPFNQRVRVVAQDIPILKCAWLPLIRIADEIFLSRKLAWHKAPLKPRRKTRAAAAA